MSTLPRKDAMELYETSRSDDYASVLVGKKIVKAQNDALWTDDGLKLTILPNEGGCCCGSGDYEVTELNVCDNVITSAVLEHEETGGEDGNTWRLFVFADNQRVNAFTVSGDDGNGYYGTGFTVRVAEAPADDPAARTRNLNDHLL